MVTKTYPAKIFQLLELLARILAIENYSHLALGFKRVKPTLDRKQKVGCLMKNQLCV